MKMEISMPEDIDIFKEIQGQTKLLYEMIRVDIGQVSKPARLRYQTYA